MGRFTQKHLQMLLLEENILWTVSTLKIHNMVKNETNFMPTTKKPQINRKIRESLTK